MIDQDLVTAEDIANAELELENAIEAANDAAIEARNCANDVKIALQNLKDLKDNLGKPRVW